MCNICVYVHFYICIYIFVSFKMLCQLRYQGTRRLDSLLYQLMTNEMMQRLNSRGEKYLQAATNKPYVHCGSDENDESHENYIAVVQLIVDFHIVSI